MTALEQVNGQSPEAAKYIQSEAQARQELLKVKQRLEKFEAIFGPHSTLPPETQALAQALREKEEAIRVLHLEQEQEQAVSVSS
jgi:E3 ubiquitin-protein ligase BRE1